MQVQKFEKRKALQQTVELHLLLQKDSKSLRL